MGMIQKIMAGIGLEAGRKVVDALDEERTRERRARQRNIAIIIASVVGLVLLAGVFLQLFRWVIGLLLLAALGYAVWYFIGPRVSALFRGMSDRRKQGRAEKQARRAEATRQEDIERTLDEIKRSMKSE